MSRAYETKVARVTRNEDVTVTVDTCDQCGTTGTPSTGIGMPLGGWYRLSYTYQPGERLVAYLSSRTTYYCGAPCLALAVNEESV